MCRTRPCNDISDVGIGRRLRASSSRPSHLSISVVRWKSSHASSMSRSGNTNAGSMRRGSVRSSTIVSPFRRGRRAILSARLGRMAETTPVPVLPPDADAEAVSAALRDAGCAVVEGLVDASIMDAIATEVAPYVDATPYGGDEFVGVRTRRTGALIARSPSFRPLATHPLVLASLDQVLGDHATSYQSHLTQVIDIGPGEPAQMIHRDQWA